jgi:hypothetical protein
MSKPKERGRFAHDARAVQGMFPPAQRKQVVIFSRKSLGMGARLAARLPVSGGCRTDIEKRERLIARPRLPICLREFASL